MNGFHRIRADDRFEVRSRDRQSTDTRVRR